MTTNVEAQTLRGKEKPLRTLAESFGKIFDEATSTDITFSVSEDGTEVKGHKLVLSTRSPVFYAMFNGGFEEKDTIDIQDAHVEDFQNFLRFLYTDEIDFSSDNVIGILHLADKYNVPLLFEKCTQYLAENLNTKNACEVFAAAKKYNSEALTSTALSFICLHAKDCLKTAGFLQLSSDDVKDISDCESLSCSEEHLFESLDKWSDEKCKEKELEVTDENKHTVLGQILFTVRFPLMEYEYRVSKISKRKICTESEVIQILQGHLANEEHEVSVAKDNITSKLNNVARKPLKYESVVLVEEGFHTLGLTGISDELKNTAFTIDTDTWLYGIMIYGPKNAMRFCVEITLVDRFQNMECARELVLAASLEHNYTCNVVLASPVYLHARRQYRCSFSVFSPSSVQFYSWQRSNEENLQPPIGFNFGSARPVDRRAMPSSEVSVLHSDTFVAKKSSSLPTVEKKAFSKSFREKKITVEERSSMLAGLLLF